MAADNKFGTFGGVFTPSILTILGVIMYLRLPWVVGEGGLYMAVGIILAAHLISWTTGLSVASIATDKKVRAGGAYYIVSRSMGLSMGGTIGVALFVGLSFSISLYIIGFTESVLDFFSLTKDLAAIRLWGSVTLVALTVITFISTSLAIKTQYVILVAIAASLVSVFAGHWDGPAVVAQLAPPEGGEAATVLFGIFFPAVTGFTAGVNMSGDLRDPRRSIPVGTVAAIAAGMVVYLSLAIYLSYAVPNEALRNDPGVLLKLAWLPEAVVAGIWGATLSSALGSILGAPRILQALSLDRITPPIFGRGTGPTSEPRIALFVAFAIGEVGILVGELDAIARIVSVFFIATYGFLNVSASFEMIASPDFRPSFRIPRAVPVIGAIASAVLMVWLDLVALLGAVVVMGALFGLLKRRELELDAGDATLGMWFSVARKALTRLSRQVVHERNWVPNILAFTHPDAVTRAALLDFGYSLIRQRGVFTELSMDTPADDPTATYEHAASADATQGALTRFGSLDGFFTQQVKVPAGELFEVMTAATRFHGFAGLQHNTVMLDWHEHASELDPFARYLDELRELDLNVMCLAYEGRLGFAHHRRIDLWWSPRAGNVGLYFALMRFLTVTEEWKDAELRFFLISDDRSTVDSLFRAVTRAAEDARIELQVKIVNNTVQPRTDDEWIVEYSATTDLTVVGLPRTSMTAAEVRRIEALGRAIGAVLLVRGSSRFAESLLPDRVVSDAAVETDTGTPLVLLPELVVPAPPAFAAEARRFSGDHQALARDVADAVLKPGFDGRVALLQNLRAQLAASFQGMQRTLRGRRSRARERAFVQTVAELLHAVAELIEDHGRHALSAQAAAAERGLRGAVEAVAPLESDAPELIPMHRPADDFAPCDDDAAGLRRFKARRRFACRLLRGEVPAAVPARRLARYYCVVSTGALLQDALVLSAGSQAELRGDVQRFVTELASGMQGLLWRSGEVGLDRARVQAEGTRLLALLDELIGGQETGAARTRAELLATARALQQRYADDLDRPELGYLLGRQRRVRQRDVEGLEARVLVPARWADAEQQALAGTALAARLTAVDQQLQLGLRRLARGVELGLSRTALLRATELREALVTFRDRLDADGAAALEFAAPGEGRLFEPAALLDSLRDVEQRATAALPEVLSLLREASLAALPDAPDAATEAGEVRVREAVRVVIDGVLLRPLAETLAEVPRAGRRMHGVVEDVDRLVSFNISELSAADGSDEDEPAVLLAPVLAGAIDRLDREAEALAAQVQQLGAAIEEIGREASDRLQALALRGSVDGFEHQRGGTPDRLSGLSRMAADAVDRVGRGVVALAYRESTSVLLARSLQEGATAEAGVEGVFNLVEAALPRPAVLAALPVYYRQLFLAQTMVPSAFWVGRDAELAAVGRAVDRHGRGFAGPIVVTGPPGSGKTTLVHIAVDRFLADRPLHRVTPPPGGSADEQVFAEVLGRSLGLAGSPRDVLGALPTGSVVVFQDIECWWERAAGGERVIQLLLDIVAEHSSHCLFILEVGSAPLRFLRRFASIDGEALAVIECGPVDALALNRIVLLRHDSTGVALTLSRQGEEPPSELAKARLFTALFHRSGGNIGAALAGWMASATEARDGLLRVQPPASLDLSAMDALSGSCLALLLQLAIHRSLSLRRLQRVSGLPEHDIAADLARLRRTGIVAAARRELIEMTPQARDLVHRYLDARRMLP